MHNIKKKKKNRKSDIQQVGGPEEKKYREERCSKVEQRALVKYEGVRIRVEGAPWWRPGGADGDVSGA